MVLQTRKQAREVLDLVSEPLKFALLCALLREGDSLFLTLHKQTESFLGHPVGYTTLSQACTVLVGETLIEKTKTRKGYYRLTSQGRAVFEVVLDTLYAQVGTVILEAQRQLLEEDRGEATEEFLRKATTLISSLGSKDQPKPVPILLRALHALGAVNYETRF